MRHSQGFPARERARAPLRKLADCQRFSRRAQAVLSGIVQRSATHLGASLKTAFDGLGQDLQHGETGRGGEDRAATFDLLGVLRREQAAVTDRFVQSIESALAELEGPAPAPQDAGDPAPIARPVSLELVDQGLLEEELALQNIATRGETRHAEALFLIGHRFAVLAASPIIGAGRLPIGPSHLAEALRDAIEPLDLTAAQRVVVYRLFDRNAMASAGGYYAAINDWFVEQRILPGLRPRRAPARASEAPPPAASETADARTAPVPAPAADPAPSAPPAAAAAPASGEGLAGPADSLRLYTHLRGLLNGEVPAPAARASSGGPGVADARAVQSALHRLQERSARQTTGAGLGSRGVTHLKRDLVAQLRQMGSDGQPLALSREDGDTIDLVGMLFGHLSRETGLGETAQDLLARMQLPLMRVALADPGFFTQSEHPARKLLNTVIEAGERWIDDADPDPDLLLRLQQVVKQVSHGDVSDPVALDDLHKGLAGHVQALARRAEIAERRQIEAAKGREKLEIARRQARTALARMIDRADPPTPLRDMLERTWVPVLALTLLRQGEGSALFHRRLAVADQLLRRSALDDRPVDQALRREVEEGLGQIGMHGDDIQVLTQALFDPARPDRPGAEAALTDVTGKLGAWGRSMDTAAGPGDAAPAAVEDRPAPIPLSTREQQILEQIKGLPFGTWFEFQVNQQGDTVRRKLAWFSTLTGRCLFVNQRGLRVEDGSLDHLARDIARGQVRPARNEQRGFVDRAWDTILSALRRMAPGDAAQTAPS